MTNLDRERQVKRTDFAMSLSVAMPIGVVVAISSHAAERITYYHTDALGSPTAATDQQGNVVWREAYEPYGERIKKEPASSSNPRWYTGHVLDAETGLQYARARYYDPVIGRFMGVDPAPFTERNIHSFNRYAYAANNPYKYVDPDGKRIVFSQGATPQFQQQFAQIVQYLNASGTSGTIARLEARPETVRLQESPTPHGFHYNPNTKTIVFDPLSGLQVGSGQVQTPALGVLHEAGHALQDLQNPRQLQKDANTPVPNYHNREEQRVIVGIETPAATRLGEPTRQHHGGTPIRVQCPVCDK